MTKPCKEKQKSCHAVSPPVVREGRHTLPSLRGCPSRLSPKGFPFQRLERKFYWPEHMFHPVEPRNLRGITDAGKEEKTGNPSSGVVHPQQRSRCQEQERLGYFPSYSRLTSPPAFERTDMNTKRGEPCGPPLCFLNVQRNNKRRDSGFRDVTLRHKRNPNC